MSDSDDKNIDEIIEEMKEYEPIEIDMLFELLANPIKLVPKHKLKSYDHIEEPK